ALRRSVPDHAGMQLSGSAGARQHETIGRSAHPGKRERTHDGPVRTAAAPGSVESLVFCRAGAPPAVSLDGKVAAATACPTILEARLSIFSVNENNQRKAGSAKEGARSAAQAGCVPHARPVQSRHLRRQSAGSAEA